MLQTYLLHSIMLMHAEKGKNLKEKLTTCFNQHDPTYLDCIDNEYLSCNVNLDNNSMFICKQLAEFTTQRYTDDERLSFLSDKLCIL